MLVVFAHSTTGPTLVTLHRRPGGRGAVRALAELTADFEAAGTVHATWPAHLIATPPPPRGIRRGRRGRT